MSRYFKTTLSLAGFLLAFLSGPAHARVVYFPQDQAPTVPMWFTLGEPDSGLEDLLWQAQCEGSECYDKEYGSGEGPKGTKGASLNKGFTKEILKVVKSANSTCDDDRILLKYRIDCLRVYYGWAADIIPDTGEYLPIKKALRRAESKLAAIVSANVDKNEPVIRPRDNHKKNAKKLPPLRPVKKSAEKKAVAQAKEVVKEAELVILRSGEDPSRREPHYTEVAAAVDSNLLILRSA
jgi:hypothetical protein